MEKQVRMIVSFDLAGFVNAINKFLKELGHYELFDIKYIFNDKGYTALILHQKIYI